MLRVEIDRERCQGHGQCVMLAPAVFDLDEDGLSVGSTDELDELQRLAAKTAELGCPVGAIRLVT